MKISETIRLKNISKNDLKTLRVLMDRIYHPAYTNYWKDCGRWYVETLYNEENLNQELQEDNTDYFFVVLESKIIGIIRTVWGIDTHYQSDKNYVKLHRLYLDQEIQNKGTGRIIMDWLIKEANRKGYKKLWLEVMEKQHQAIYFYKKLNFEKVDRVIVDFPLLYDDYRGMYKMVKELN
jgi:GNAT superfamily N-acetyltransferase